MGSHRDDQSRVHLGSRFTSGDVALFKDIADAAAERAVSKAFVAMGLDPSQPLVSQESFAVLRQLAGDEGARADFAWLRRTRLRAEGIVGKALVSAVGIGVVGAGHALWTGIKYYVSAGVLAFAILAVSA
jgi:hypothetical protein